MLCCFDSFGGGSHAGQQSAGVSTYPGARRNDLVPTGGNALSAAPPASQKQGSVGGSNKEMIKVTVPPGVSAGQPLHVNAPDGRTIQAVVPQGFGPGSSFLVEMPPRTMGAPSTHSTVPPINYGGVQPMAPPPATKPAGQPYAQAYPVGSPTTAKPAAPPVALGPGGQAVMRVQVPPGVAPGTTLHVRVPGEDRTIAAVVPPGVSEFQVAYDRVVSAPPAAEKASSQPFSQALSSPAKPAAASAAASQPFSMALNNPPPTAPTMTSSQPFSASLGGPSAPVASAPLPTPMPLQQSHHSSSSEKLILVRVPPGTAPGATLHVSIPDEPGRLIAAKVPPGVSEFHVSYKPNQPQPSATSYGSQQAPMTNNTSNNKPASSGNYNGGSGGRMGNFLMPMMGGAALGAAGMGMFNHFSDNDTGDYDGGGDYGGGDYGGGDYGGGDFGGGDFGGDF